MSLSTILYIHGNNQSLDPSTYKKMSSNNGEKMIHKLSENPAKNVWDLFLLLFIFSRGYPCQTKV